MSRLGKRIVRDLRQFLADIKAGKPMKQSVLRRVWVKGKPSHLLRVIHCAGQAPSLIHFPASHPATWQAAMSKTANP